MTRWVDKATAALVLGLFATGSPGADAPARPGSSNEQRLEAVRTELANKAMQAPSRVRSTAWIDESGRLRENTEITSELKVRGIRVLSYLPDNEAAREEVQIETAPVSLGDGQCAQRNRRLKRVALLDIDFEPRDGRNGNYYLEGIARHIDTELRDQFHRTPDWVLQRVALESSYQQAAIHGPRTSAPYSLQIHVKPARDVPAALSRRVLENLGLESPQAAARIFIVSARLVDSSSGALVWQGTSRVTYPASPTAMVTAPLPAATVNELTRAITGWRAEIDTITACEPLYYNVAPRDSGAPQVNAGSRAGVRVGDQFVVIDPARVPSRVLEKGLPDAVHLAEVVAVGTDWSTLRYVGEGPQPASVRWIALPL